ncbi:MAG: hypothetical protein ACI3VZ_05120 [Faecousia sp.]
MAKEKINLRNELRSYKLEYDLLEKIPCSEQENTEYENRIKNGGVLPEGVFAYVYDYGETSTTDFYTVKGTDLTESEIAEYLTFKKLSMIRTIKNCVLFFTVLTIIGMVACFFIMLNAM